VASIFDPHNFWAVIGVVLFLIALYLVLENYVGATNILSNLFSGSVGLAGTLQGRSVTVGGVKVGQIAT
jgi:hypothetical protein